MSHKRQVWETFSQLAQRLLAAADGDVPAPTLDLREVLQELKRLGKAQFKANALQEAALDQLRQAMNQLTALEEEAQRRAQADALHDLLAALLPVVDGLEAALDSGERLLARAAEDSTDRWAARHLSQGPDQEQASRLVLQSDRALMVAWLDGLRLVRQRLLALLADAGVEPIPTVGQPFDPYLHRAVGTATDGAHPPGAVVTEQRQGYTGPRGVLRYAEVIVNREVGESPNNGELAV
jgi:molecular chaperone GrpE